MKESYSRFKTRTTLQQSGDFDHIAVSLPHFSKSYASRFFLTDFDAGPILLPAPFYNRLR